MKLIVDCMAFTLKESLPSALRMSPSLQDATVYLLDDILAAVDATVSKWLLENVICGRLLAGKTRVLCTHSSACTQAADVLIHMRRGRASASAVQDTLHETSSTASEVLF